MSSTPVVVLHAGAAVTLEEYLSRVLVYLLVFAGIGVTVLWGVRVLEMVQSGIAGRREITDDDS